MADELWRAVGCVAQKSALRPELMPLPDDAMGAVDGLGGPQAHATPADGHARLGGIGTAAVVDRLMTLVAP